MGSDDRVTRLLVPLTDGTADGTALRAVVDVARSARSIIHLLYVRSLPRADMASTLTASELERERRRLEAEGSRHLDAVAAGLDDVPVERVIRLGDVETTILDEAASWRANLVALSAGDRTWLSHISRVLRSNS
jgi:nucleotide-binding universal stress UspA family protein